MTDITFDKKDLDRSNIPVGEIRTIHQCPSTNKYYDIERGRKRLVGKTPFTNDWIIYVNGYLVSAWFCPYCGADLSKEEEEEEYK